MVQTISIRRYETMLCVLICMVTFKIATAAVGPPQVVINGLPHVLCTSPLSYHVDPSLKFSFDDIKDMPFSSQTGGLSLAIEKYGVQAHYWMKFALDNLDSLPVTAYLDAGYSGVIRIYEIQDGKTVVRNSGLALAKDLNVSYPELSTIKFVIPPRSTIQYFVCLFSTPDYAIGFDRVNIFSGESLRAAFYRTYYEGATFRFFQLLFLGLMLTEMTYVAFSWIIGNRRKEYVYYLVYLLLVTVYFLQKFNRGEGIYWPFEYFPSIRVYLKSVLLALPYAFYLRFTRYFLDLSELDNRINRKFIHLERFIEVYVLVDTVLRFVLPDPEELNSILMVTISGIALYCLVLIFQLMRHKKVLVNLILTGSLAAAFGGGIGVLITLLRFYVARLSIGFNNLLGAQVGVVIETIIFTASLSYKTRLMEIEKVEDQRKLIAQMKENAVLKEKMEQTRNKIARDLHDDIGSTLSSILLFSNAAKSKIKFTAGEAREVFGKISEIAGMMMDEMSDIIWAINPRQDSMEQILKRMQYYAAPLTLARNIQFHFKADDDIRYLHLDMEKRKNLLLIFKESVINALKYSEAANLRVRFYFADNFLHMVVEDDGKGFSHPSEVGNGLNNMKTRAKNVGGQVEIDSVENVGTTVSVSLPL